MFLTHFLCLCQLRDGSTHQGTVTSMEPNEGTFILHGETAKVISSTQILAWVYKFEHLFSMRILCFSSLQIEYVCLLLLVEEYFWVVKMWWNYVYPISSCLFNSCGVRHTITDQILSYVSLVLTEGKDKTCSYCWCTWAFSSSTQTGWVLTSSSWNSLCGWCFRLLTKLPCCLRVIPFSTQLLDYILFII